MNDQVFRLGIDPGFGNFKIASVISGKLVVTHIASVVGIGSTDTGLLDRLPGQRRQRMNRPDVVNFNGISYLVGAVAGRYTRQISQRLDFQHLADGPELRALLYVALWRLLGQGMHVAVAMVGLPVEVMQQRELAGQILHQLQDWLINRHEFMVNGQIVTVTITAVKIIAQPAGSYFDWSLNEAGGWSRSREVLQAPVTVVDGGYNTVDLYTLRDGNIDPRYVGGEKIGMRRVSELVRSGVQATYGINLSLFEADELVRPALTGGSPSPIYHAAGTADINPLIQQALASNFAEVSSFIDQRLGNARQFPYLLFTGGQMQALKPQLSTQFPHAQFLDITANARGLAKFAQRRQVFDI